MNELIYEGIRFLELMKWASLDGRTMRARDNVDFWKRGYIPPLSTPEGLEISVHEMFLCYNKFSESYIDEMWKILYDFERPPEENNKEGIELNFSGTGSNAYKMTPDALVYPNPQLDNVAVYLFASKKLKKNPQKLELVRNDFISKGMGTGYLQPGFGYYPGSFILVDLGETTDFSTFCNMTEATWKNHLSDAIEGAKTNGQFENLLMYHPLILEKELSLADRKAIISYIMNQESWSWWDFDGFDEGQCVYELFSYASDEDGAALYDWLFEGNYWKFKKLHDLMQGNDFFTPFMLTLLRHYYSNLRSTVGDPLIISTVKNLPINHIIPVGLRVLSNIGEGAYHITQINGQNITFDTVYFRYLDRKNGGLKQKDWDYTDGMTFDLFETIGIVSLFDRVDKGFVTGKVYPMPAFMVPAIHDLLSDDASVLDLVGEFFDLAAIALPFFKLFTAGFALSEAISLFYGVIAYDIGEAQSLLENSEVGGKDCLGWFNYVNTVWNWKDGVSALNRAFDMYHEYGKIVLNDFDDLAYAWTVYQDTDEYKDNININEDLRKLGIAAKDFIRDVDEINKSLNRTPVIH